MSLNLGKTIGFSNNYHELKKWLSGPAIEELMPDYLESYQYKVNIAHSLLTSLEGVAGGEPYMMNALISKFEGKIKPKEARQLLYEAANIYLTDATHTKEVFVNIEIQHLQKVAASAYIDKDYKGYAAIKKLLYELKGIYKEENELPQEWYRQPLMIFSVDPEDVGIERVDRKALAAQIDSFKIAKDEKNRIKIEAGIKPDIEDVQAIP